jgi:hypothetical protein
MKGSGGCGELISSGSFAALRMTAETFFLILRWAPDDGRNFLPDPFRLAAVSNVLPLQHL